MLIEQIIEFELRGPGPPGRTYAPKTAFFFFFHDKTKLSKANVRVNYYLLLKILLEAMYLTSPHLGQVIYKIYPQNARF